MKKMFKVLDVTKLEEMGFVKDGKDYVYKSTTEEGMIRKLFSVYAGSTYLRYAKTVYVTSEQLRLIYEWTKKNYIEWEE